MPENVSRKDFVKYGLDFLTQINRRANAVVNKHDEYESKTREVRKIQMLLYTKQRFGTP